MLTLQKRSKRASLDPLITERCVGSTIGSGGPKPVTETVTETLSVLQRCHQLCEGTAGIYYSSTNLDTDSFG